MKPYVVTYLKWRWDDVEKDAVVYSRVERSFWREKDAGVFFESLTGRAEVEAFEWAKVIVILENRYLRDSSFFEVKWVDVSSTRLIGFLSGTGVGVRWLSSFTLEPGRGLEAGIRRLKERAVTKSLLAGS
mgnify:CR=1 FL=1